MRHSGRELREFDRTLADADRRHRSAVIAGACIAGLVVVTVAAAGWWTLASYRQKAQAREQALTSPLAADAGRHSAAVPADEEPRAEKGEATHPAESQKQPSAPKKTAAAAVERSETTALKANPKPKPKPALVPTEKVSIRIGASGYEPSSLTVKSGVPVVLTVARGEGCAAGFLMPKLGVSADNSTGPATIKLGRLKSGTYRFTCGMEMVEGRLVVQ